MRYHFLAICCLIWFGFLSIISCSRDSIEPITGDCDEIITYELHIKSIINSTCSYAGCHDGTAPGDFSTYSGLKPTTENGKFRKNVIIEQIMPPADAPSGPTNLTEAQLLLMLCWADQGYLEN
jgi:hypothetical protein